MSFTIKIRTRSILPYTLGEAISEFLKPQVQNSLSPYILKAVRKINDGAKILADLFYRLSMIKRAQVIPALNLMAKFTAEAIPIDELLFDASFGKEMKKANAMEKTSKDIIKTPLAVTRGDSSNQLNNLCKRFLPDRETSVPLSGDRDRDWRKEQRQ